MVAATRVMRCSQALGGTLKRSDGIGFLLDHSRPPLAYDLVGRAGTALPSVHQLARNWSFVQPGLARKMDSVIAAATKGSDPSAALYANDEFRELVTTTSTTMSQTAVGKALRVLTARGHRDTAWYVLGRWLESQSEPWPQAGEPGELVGGALVAAIGVSVDRFSELRQKVDDACRPSVFTAWLAASTCLHQAYALKAAHRVGRSTTLDLRRNLADCKALLEAVLRGDTQFRGGSDDLFQAAWAAGTMARGSELRFWDIVWRRHLGTAELRNTLPQYTYSYMLGVARRAKVATFHGGHTADFNDTLLDPAFVQSFVRDVVDAMIASSVRRLGSGHCCVFTALAAADCLCSAGCMEGHDVCSRLVQLQIFGPTEGLTKLIKLTLLRRHFHLLAARGRGDLILSCDLPHHCRTAGLPETEIRVLEFSALLQGVGAPSDTVLWNIFFEQDMYMDNKAVVVVFRRMWPYVRFRRPNHPNYLPYDLHGEPINVGATHALFSRIVESRKERRRNLQNQIYRPPTAMVDGGSEEDESMLPKLLPTSCCDTYIQLCCLVGDSSGLELLEDDTWELTEKSADHTAKLIFSTTLDLANSEAVVRYRAKVEQMPPDLQSLLRQESFEHRWVVGPAAEKRDRGGVEADSQAARALFGQSAAGGLQRITRRSLGCALRPDVGTGGSYLGGGLADPVL